MGKNIDGVDGVDRNVSIVIPVYNHYDLTHQCIMDLQQFAPFICECIVMDDCSTDTTQRGLEFWKHTSYFPLRSVRNSENLGFLLNTNKGISQTVGDIIVLVNNDVRVLQNFMQDLLLTLKNNPKSLVGGVVYTHNTGWNNFGGKIIPYVEGWLLAAHRELWEKTGGFDVRYAPSDFEDVDFSMQALQLGYELRSVDHLKHLGGRSYGYTSERLERTRKNRGIFAAKWGLDE